MEDFLKYLIQKGLIKQQDRQKIQEISKNTNLPIVEVIVRERFAKDNEVYQYFAKFYGYTYVEVGMLELDNDLIEKFGYNVIKKHKILPISVSSENILTVAISNPADFVAKSMISNFLYAGVIYVLASPLQIENYINSLQATQSTSSALFDLQDDGQSHDVNQAVEDDEKIKNTPAVRLLDSIIKEAITQMASDIHIEPFENDVKVRYRIDGDLLERATFPMENYPAVCARLKIISGLNIAERRLPQDGRINLSINGQEFDFRVSSLPTVFGEKFVVRILDKHNFNFTRKELGFLEKENNIIDKTLQHPYGIILMTGPTGCGKSTTLYSFLKELNKPTKNIVTVEDPIEYTMEGINQTQVNSKANLTFSVALRSILRQDPDIIMIGEIRDNETAQIAIRAAITGHLVLSTLHTNDAVGAITRLMDMGITDFLVADALVCVISQRLVKKLCPKCKKKSITTKQEMEILKLTTPIEIYKPCGCNYCNHTGYKGRVPIREIMYVTDEIKNAINANLTDDKIRKIARGQGFVELWDACQNSVINGYTSIEEIKPFSID